MPFKYTKKSQSSLNYLYLAYANPQAIIKDQAISMTYQVSSWSVKLISLKPFMRNVTAYSNHNMCKKCLSSLHELYDIIDIWAFFKFWSNICRRL